MNTPADGFSVIELRRYTIRDGGCDAFVRCFDTWFPEAFQQLGAAAIGQFTEPRDSTRFTWLRAFRDMDARACGNAGFYYGPVWKEHRERLNSLMLDSDDVLLLRPANPGRGPLVLPAVDPVSEAGGAQGMVVAQVFALREARADAFGAAACAAFARYRDAGAREGATLVTLDAPNNFPQLPVRADGPHFVWLGVVEDLDAAARLQALAEQAAAELAAAGWLRAEPLFLLLQPTPRSRLRWLPAWSSWEGSPA